MSAFYAASKRTKRVAVDGRSFCSLTYRYSGKVLIKSGDTEFISEATSVTFMPENTDYETEIIDDTKMAVIHFRLDKNIHCNSPTSLVIRNKEIPLLFENLIQSFRVDKPMDFNCMSILYSLLAKLESLVPNGREEYLPRKIALAKELMIKRFSEPSFSIAALAENMGVSTSYLRREFSKAYGKNPITFLRDLRIEKAKLLLQSEYLSIANIGEQSGFSCDSYFIQVFHKAVGVSPDRYRQMLHNK